LNADFDFWSSQVKSSVVGSGSGRKHKETEEKKKKRVAPPIANQFDIFFEAHCSPLTNGFRTGSAIGLDVILNDPMHPFADGRLSPV
jgi:hypothetical protein